MVFVLVASAATAVFPGFISFISSIKLVLDENLWCHCFLFTTDYTYEKVLPLSIVAGLEVLASYMHIREALFDTLSDMEPQQKPRTLSHAILRATWPL